MDPEGPPAAPLRQKENRLPYNVRFAHVSVQEASNKKKDFPARREASSVYLAQLGLTTDQLTTLKAAYDDPNSNLIQSNTYDSLSEEEQTSGASLLAAIGLDADSRQSYASRWKVKWQRESGKGEKANKRVLYQWCVSASFSGTIKLKTYQFMWL